MAKSKNKPADIININNDEITILGLTELLEDSLDSIGIMDDELSPEKVKQIAISLFYHIKDKH